MPELEDCLLRPVEERDLEKILEWRNSDRVRRVMFTDRIISPEDHRAWFERISGDHSFCCLVFEAMGRPGGVVNFVRINRPNGTCFWGFYLGDRSLPGGTGRVMGRLALDYAFDALGLRKVYAEVIASNLKSLEFHEKLGFVVEGRLKRHVLKSGKYEDVILLALFREKWAGGGKK